LKWWRQFDRQKTADETGRCGVNKGKGLFGSFRVTLALSILVGIVVPISMLGDLPETSKWRTFIIIGVLSFASYWAIASVSWIIMAFMVRRSKHRKCSLDKGRPRKQEKM
jgi:bacteriorhodopsin